ncbi:MAG: UpxY family transcription antiterminator [Acidobacteriia bacterium]|nr:UpxY family transcription antiterminator [Terriglobia bacterium]
MISDKLQPNGESRQWFAFRVKSRSEKLVSAAAHSKGFEEFLPLCCQRRRWSDRFKSVELPLFPGYVFCRLDATYRLPLLTIPGVLHVVGIGKIPVPIDDAEIAAIQTAMRSGLTVEPWPFLDVGQRVRVEYGPLAGMEGILVELRKQNRIVISVSLLKRSVGVEIEADWVAPLNVRTHGLPLPTAGTRS